MSRITGNEVANLIEAYQKVYEPKVEENEQLDEITADLALRASKAADRKRGQFAAAQDKPAASAKAAQAARLYAKQAKKRLATKEEVEDFDSLIEEIVEELLEDCLEFGYEVDESLELIETAALDYLNEVGNIDEAKITYGSDTESPEQRKARAKEKHTAMKSAARKAAVKGAVSNVKAKVRVAKAAAGIAGSIAKDEARRAGRAVSHSIGKASSAAGSASQRAKEQVKSGIKKMLGRGLRAAAGGAGKVAQAARKAGSAAGKAAERLGEEHLVEISQKTATRAFATRATDEFESDGADYNYTKSGKSKADETKRRMEKKYGKASGQHAERAAHAKIFGRGKRALTSMPPKPTKEEFDVFDVVLEYLIYTGHAETISEAEYIMSQMDSESIEAIVEETLTEKLAKGTKGVSFSTGKHSGGFDQAMTEKNPRTNRQRKTSPEMKAIGAHSKAKSAQWKAENEGRHDDAARHKTRRDKIAHVVYNKTNRIIDRADND